MAETQGMKEQLDKLAAELGRRLLEREIMLATAESCTGGWIAQVITGAPGSSAWFDRGFVTYSNLAKQEMLGVSDTSLETQGAVSAQVVAEMLAGALQFSQAQATIAVSGIAGPGGGTEDKPVGTVFLGWALAGREPLVRRFQFAGDREEVRRQTVRLALERFIELFDEDG